MRSTRMGVSTRRRPGARRNALSRVVRDRTGPRRLPADRSRRADRIAGRTSTQLCRHVRSRAAARCRARSAGRHRRATRCAAGMRGEVLVLAAATGTDGYDSRPTLDDGQWATLLANLDRLADAAADRGVLAVLHPHVGTMVETRSEVDRVLRRLEHQAVPGHRPSADRRDRSAAADPRGAGPNRPRTSEGCRCRACRPRAGRGAHLQRGRTEGHVHPAGCRRRRYRRAS